MVLRSPGRTSKRSSSGRNNGDRKGRGDRKPSATPGLKLNLCCGSSAKPGFLGIDWEQGPEVDQVVDLNKLPWPWEDNSVDEVCSSDGVEHLAPLGREKGQLNIIAVLKEIHRILKPGGGVELMVPSTDGRGAFQDPTHVTFWNKNTFLYFSSNQGFEHFNKFSLGYPRFEIDSMLNVDGDLLVTWVHVLMHKQA